MTHKQFYFLVSLLKMLEQMLRKVSASPLSVNVTLNMSLQKVSNDLLILESMNCNFLSMGEKKTLPQILNRAKIKHQFDYINILY